MSLIYTQTVKIRRWKINIAIAISQESAGCPVHYSRRELKIYNYHQHQLIIALTLLCHP